MPGIEPADQSSAVLALEFVPDLGLERCEVSVERHPRFCLSLAQQLASETSEFGYATESARVLALEPVRFDAFKGVFELPGRRGEGRFRECGTARPQLGEGVLHLLAQPHAQLAGAVTPLQDPVRRRRVVASLEQSLQLFFGGHGGAGILRGGRVLFGQSFGHVCSLGM